jgi:hypothetical protein
VMDVLGHASLELLPRIDILTEDLSDFLPVHDALRVMNGPSFSRLAYFAVTTL